MTKHHVAYLRPDLPEDTGEFKDLMDETVKAAVEGATALVTPEQWEQLRAGTHWLSVETEVEKRPDGNYRMHAWPVTKLVAPKVADDD